MRLCGHAGRAGEKKAQQMSDTENKRGRHISQRGHHRGAAPAVVSPLAPPPALPSAMLRLPLSGPDGSL